MSTRISIINFKGGVGKTTLAFHIAAYLSKHGKTLLIDIDHQSSLSIVALGAALWEQRAAAGDTVNKIFDSFCNRKIKFPGDEIIVKNAFFSATNGDNNDYPNLDVVPSQFELDDTEIDLASTTYGNAALSDWEKRTLLAAWLDTINADTIYKYVIFDCPPATKIVSQNALAASDYYVIPVIPDDMSSRGVTHFRHLVNKKIDKKLDYLRDSSRVLDKDVPRNFVPKTQLAAIVPSLAQPANNSASGLISAHTEQVGELRAAWGKDVTATVIKRLAGVTEAMNAGWPVWDCDSRNVNPGVKEMFSTVCQEIKDKVD